MRAVSSSEWATTIAINGTYSGPTDIVLCEDYQLKWVINGSNLLELGTAILRSASKQSVRQVWSSIITPKKTAGKLPAALKRFPSEGELISASISPFQVDGNKMSYEWKGTVRRTERH